MASVVSLVIFALDLRFCTCLVHSYATVPRCRIVVMGFHDLLLVCFLGCLLCLESWELVGKEES